MLFPVSESLEQMQICGLLSKNKLKCSATHSRTSHLSQLYRGEEHQGASLWNLDVHLFIVVLCFPQFDTVLHGAVSLDNNVFTFSWTINSV